MNLTNQVIPHKEEFLKFIKEYPAGQPVTMVNILKFRTQTGNGEETGKEAYRRYSQNMIPLLQKAGGKVIWFGKIRQTLIGDYQTSPDMVLIVSYPSKEAFIEMSTSPEYDVTGKDREIALQYGGLLAANTVDFG